MKSLRSLGSTKFHIINLLQEINKTRFLHSTTFSTPKHRNSCIEWAVERTGGGLLPLFLEQSAEASQSSRLTGAFRLQLVRRFVNVFLFSQGKCWYPWDGTLDKQPLLHPTYNRPVFIGYTIPGNTTIFPLFFLLGRGSVAQKIGKNLSHF